MRIRNHRPPPSIFPPPPDLNFIPRSFRPSSPKHHQLPPPPLQVQLSTTPRTSDYHHQTNTLHPHDLLVHDHPPATGATDFTHVKLYRKRKPSASVAANTHKADDNQKDGNNEDDTAMHPFSHNKDAVNNGVAVKRVSKPVGAVNVEGSRCSRVNGRGWRCGHQTLVGYSLCEHHLGKSRLRSLSSVKNITTDRKHKFVNKKKELVEESDDDEEPLIISTGSKKSRIGTVKARSLSSLLGLTGQSDGVSKPSSTHKRNAGN